MTYVSDRGIPLLCQTPWEHGPMVTVENHNKWYNLYILHPDGEVEKVKVETVSAIEAKYSETFYLSDNFNPKLLYLIAAAIGGDVDWLSSEVVTGRWVHEIEGTHCWIVDEFN